MQEGGGIPLSERIRAPGTIRVMTYNTHASRGRDRKVSEERIAAVIQETGPDILALQEVDRLRQRSSLVDQAEVLASLTGMDWCFSSARRLRLGEYGNALLSRFPLNIEKDALLPRPPGLPVESRSAQLVTLELPRLRLQILHTHLGLLGFERLRQIRTLLGPDWLGLVTHPLILCGDLNALPRSKEIRMLRQLLDPVHPEEPTFPVAYPLWQIDHLFHTPQLRVVRCFVHRTPLARQASDHYPLVADFQVKDDSQHVFKQAADLHS